MNETAQRLTEIHATLETLTSSPYSHDVVELALATATSLPLGGGEHPCPVWLLIAGVPSSGKTESVLLLKDAGNVRYLDTMTENSFVSGYVESKTGDAPKDLLPELDGKCLVIKDLTTLFSMREDKVKKLLGDLQSIYDGEYSKATGTRGVISYNSSFCIVACVTPVALHKHHNYMSMIGGRFLVFRLLPLTDEERGAGFDKAWDEESKKHNLPKLRRLLLEHMNDILTKPIQLEKENPYQQDQLNRLALLLARGRGVVIKEKRSTLDEDTGNDKYRYEITNVQVEEPYRALAQLKTLGRALARIHGRSCMTSHETELLRRVVLSSVLPGRSEALSCFTRMPLGVTVDGLAEGLRCGETWTRSLLNELSALDLVSEVKGTAGWVYRPKGEVADLIEGKITILSHVQDLSLEEEGPSQNSPQTNPHSGAELIAPVGSLV